jgi:hypothetical protein
VDRIIALSQFPPKLLAEQFDGVRFVVDEEKV